MTIQTTSWEMFNSREARRIFLKYRPWRCTTFKKRLSLRYIKPLDIFKDVRYVSYWLVLPHGLLTVHFLLSVLIFKKYHRVRDYIIHQDSELFDKEHSYDEKGIIILDRDVKMLRTKVISFVRVQRKNHSIEEATWGNEAIMHRCYPYLFINSGNLCCFSYLGSNCCMRMNKCLTGI